MNQIVKLILATILIWASCHLENDPPISRDHVIPLPESTIENAMSVRNYEEVVTGRAAEADGTLFSFSVFKSNDGRSISTRYTPGSPGSVAKAFRAKLRSAIKILEQTRKEGTDQRDMEQRAVVLIPGATKKNQSVNVLLVNGSRLLVIEADSVENALDFERWYFSTHIP